VRLDDKDNAMTTTVHPDYAPRLRTGQQCTGQLHPDNCTPTTARPTFRTGKLAQPRVEYKLHNITEAIPQRVSSGVAQLP
jgi:hypothetical protein